MANESDAIKDKLQNNRATNTGEYKLPETMIDGCVAYSNFVLVVEEAARAYQGAIVLPDSAKKREWSRVLSVGPDCAMGVLRADGSYRKLEPGDLVMYYQGVTSIIDGKPYMSVPNDRNNIMVVYTKEKLAEYKAKNNGALPPAPQLPVKPD